MNPQKALDLYLDSRANELADATLKSTEYRLTHLVRWCDQQGIDDIATLNPQDMHDYRVWRRHDGDLAPASEKTQMDSVRVFLRWCERMNIVDDDLHTAVVSPTLSQEDKQSDDIVDWEQAKTILEYLDRYHYASRDHALFLLCWRTAMRTGGLRAIDLDDYHSDDQYVVLNSRPDTDTRLKNGVNGERHVALSEETCRILDDYIDQNRVDITDDYGRRPLFTTKQGRIAKNTVRGTIYRYTRPCQVGGGCPHNRDPDDCKAVQQPAYAYDCPSSTAAHSVRRGGLTHILREDVPETVVSDRADVSDNVLEDHYDQRSSKERMEQRRGYLDNI